jgi:hypothetical protein
MFLTVILIILTDVLVFAVTPGPATFTPGPFFPAEPFKEFYKGFGPSQTSVQPQPKVTNIMDGVAFPLDLTNPATIPLVSVYEYVQVSTYRSTG